MPKPRAVGADGLIFAGLPNANAYLMLQAEVTQTMHQMTWLANVYPWSLFDR